LLAVQLGVWLGALKCSNAFTVSLKLCPNVLTVLRTGLKLIGHLLDSYWKHWLFCGGVSLCRGKNWS